MVTKVQEYGFCAGVQNAVDNAKRQHESILAGRKVYLYGDLVNNVHVMREFKEKGFCVTDDIKSIPDHAVVVIRAHGISHSVYNELESKNITIEDCTCVRVAKIHEIVRKKSSEGYKIIVIGKNSHPEVTGIVGWCVNGSAYVVEKETDLDTLDLSGKICVVAQTTCNRGLLETATGYISDKNAWAEIYDTTCNVTKKRAAKAKSLAEASGAMLIIGDINSSNSLELHRQCRLACENTFFINSLSDLEKNTEMLNKILDSDSIGLAASASTPDDVISEIYDYLVFMDLLHSSKKEIEAASRAYLDEFSSEAVNNPFVRQSLKSLREQNEGGKRIRGAMIRLGEKIASHGANDNYLPVAVGYELFQTAILIHDDIIDKSDTRRKKDTIHAESSKSIKSARGDLISDGSAGHFGISRALCIGDYGFFISYQLLAKCDVDSMVLNKVYRLYSQILATTCEGEIMDVILPFEKISISDDYEEYKRTVTQISEYKTAWYTLAGPIMLGAVCGGADDTLLDLLKSITIPLGIAFQIKDDLLGIYSSTDILGKSILSDIRESKQTLLYGYAYKNADDTRRALLDRHYGKEDADMSDLEIVRKLFEETGAKKYAEDKIKELSERSGALISNGLIDCEYQSALRGLISYLIGREF